MTYKTTLNVDLDGLDDATIDAIRRAVDDVLGNTQPAVEAVQGWTPELAAELLARLGQRNRPVQALVIKAMATSGGEVDRAKVYELGGYPQERSLNGFTRPVAGVVNEMVSEGLLAASAACPMITLYDPNNPSYQKARGFSMPSEVAEVFASAI